MSEKNDVVAGIFVKIKKMLTVFQKCWQFLKYVEHFSKMMNDLQKWWMIYKKWWTIQKCNYFYKNNEGFTKMMNDWQKWWMI